MIVPTMAAALVAVSTVLLGAALPAPPGAIGPLLGAGARSFGTPRSSRSMSGRTRVVVGAVAGALLGSVAAGPPGLAGGALVGTAIPIARDRRRAARQAGRTEELLVDAVTAIASAVRSGRSLGQALAVAGAEVEEPLGGVLAEAAGRAALGVPLDDVLDELAQGVGGPDARLVVGILRLHRRTGGALASSLDDLVKTLRARRDGARELRSLTAQARLSAAILGLLPLGFFLFLSVVARRDVEAAYHSAAGASAIGIGLALQGAAFVWIRRLLRVEPA